MDDLTLLAFLQSEEDSAEEYIHGSLDAERTNALRDYNREPYGTEEEGLSQFVASDGLDAVETVLPDMLEIFTGSDQAVSFEPVGPEDEEGADQATLACNHVFYKQNNGFLITYTAVKDALTAKNCAVMCSKVTEDIVSTEKVENVTGEEFAMLEQMLNEREGSKHEVIGHEISETVDEMGMSVPMISAEIRITKTVKKIKVEAFPPEELLIHRRHNSPLLDDCRYVCRMMRTTLSEVRSMFPDQEFEPGEMGESEAIDRSALKVARETDQNPLGDASTSEDESLTEGWLRYEFVLVDYDGDGIAERRRIIRLNDRVIINEVYSHVPIFTASPYLRTHRWDGMSILDLTADIQRLKTEIIRGMINSLMLANTPRTAVQTTADWTSLVNMDDLLDSRPGGVVRTKDINAIRELSTTWVGQQALPLVELVEGFKENRLGISRYNQGLDADSLNKTKGGMQMMMAASQRKMKLIARIFAEVLFAPMFKSVLKLLTEGDMEPLSIRLKGRFVEMDPNDWRDGYDTTINVGLGTGDKSQQGEQLMMLMQDQSMLAGAGSTLVDAGNMFKTRKRLIETMGWKQVGEFYTDPESDEAKEKAANAPPPQPPPEIAKEQMRLQAEQQKFQAESQQDQQKFQAEQQAEQQKFQAQAQLDKEAAEREAALELQKTQMETDARVQIAQIDAAARVEVERMRQETAEFNRRIDDYQNETS